MDLITFNTNLSKTLSSEENNNHHLRNASLSSYLNCSKETFIFKLADSSQNLKSLTSIQNEHIHMGIRKNVEDEEIGVFAAEKYFNEENPRIAKKGSAIKYEKDESVKIDPVKTKPQPGTPSVHSASSWNSQSALLQNIQRNQNLRKAKRGHVKSLLASLGCSCSCGDKNSVDIDEHSNGVVHSKITTKQTVKADDLVGINKSPSNSSFKEEMNCKKIDELQAIGLKKEDSFSFPVLNSNAANQAVKLQLLEGGDDDDKRCKSLAMIGSSILEKEENISNLERRLTMLNWDSITPRVEEIEIPASSNGMHNDTESDASSDLFEIESFSNNINPYLARQESYAPSEASIEWSVATASAFDFSVMSDSEEIRTTSSTKNPIQVSLNAKTTANKDTQKPRPSILSGCKSDKSVRVAGDAYRRNEKVIPEPRRHHHRSDSLSLTRFQAESKLTGFDSRSLSPHASHLLYIQ